MKALRYWGLLTLCAVFLAPLYANADWTKASMPDGGLVRSLAVVGTDLFAGNNAGVFRTSDYGANWLATSLTGKVISSLGANDGRLFAGTNTGLLVSADLGATWTTRGTSGDVRRVAVSDGKVWATTWENNATHLYVSVDNGDHWSTIAVSPGVYPGDIAAQGNHVFIANYQGVWTTEKSETGYSSWYAIWQGDVRSMVATDTAIYAASVDGPPPIAKYGVLISRDFGSFQSAGKIGLTNLDIISVFVDGSALFAGTERGVFRSSDGGNNWTDLGLDYTVSYCFARVGTALFAGTDGGVVVTTDNGATWSTVNAGLRGSAFNHLIAQGNDALLSTSSGLFKSSDVGATWTCIGLAGHSVQTLIKGSDDALYAGSHDGVWRSNDNGTTWTHLSTTGMLDWDRTFMSVVVTPSGTIMVASEWAQTYRSTDGGDSWQIMGNGLGGPVYAMLTTPTCVFAGTYKCTYRSTDEGLTWTLVAGDFFSPGASGHVRTMAVRGTDIYAGGYEGISVSHDDGLTWTPFNIGLQNLWIRDFMVHGTDLYASTNTGLYVLSQGASAWLPVNDGGLTGNTIYRMASVEREFMAITLGLQNDYDPGREIWTRPLSEMACCSGTYGNVNQSGTIDLSDLSSLVSYLTGGGFTLPCPIAANVSGNGIVDLADLSALVSYLTSGGYTLPNCP